MRATIALGVLLSVLSVTEACANAGACGHRAYQRRNDIPYREYPRDPAGKGKNKEHGRDNAPGQLKKKTTTTKKTTAKPTTTVKTTTGKPITTTGKATTPATPVPTTTPKAPSASPSSASNAASPSSAIASSVMDSVSPNVSSTSIGPSSAVSPSGVPSDAPATSGTGGAIRPSDTPVVPEQSPIPDASPDSAAPSVVVPSNPATSATVSRIGGATVDNHILILAKDEYSAESGFHGLEGYGIPYDRVIVPQGGVSLPALNDSATHGRYSGIIVMDALSYEYAEGWHSAITDEQWKQIHDYQVHFSVRMVRINEFPGPNFGAEVDAAGAGGTGSEQDISITDTSDFPTANLKTGAGLSAKGLWHYPAKVVDTATTKAVAKFAADGTFGETVAAVINHFADGREQFVWFTSWAPQWSTTCAAFQHAHIHWLTRGLFLGKRKTHLNIQIDDVELATDMYLPPKAVFRLSPEDLEGHANWQKDLNGRLPAGSNVRLELGHNGNGDILAATDPSSGGVCTPDYAVDYPEVPETELEFKKPLGTGVDFWPKEWTTYPWSYACTQRDPLTAWYKDPSKRDQYFHVSHTFTHEEMNNATGRDASLEIQFNQAWLKQTGIADGMFSPKGIIPPAITGLHNGDVIKAWMENGIKHVVGDNTRPVLRNGESPYHPLISTVEGNGYAGLVIVPRWATSIYYNCDTWECDVQEWKDISKGYGDYNDLLENAKEVNTPYLFSLKADPYMFHQANMRLVDMPTITVGSKTGQMSMVMGWVESVAQEVARVTNWPIVSLKHDDFTQYFLDRQALDGCKPSAVFKTNADGSQITHVEVHADNMNCPAEVPITIPGGGASGGRTDQVGSEPPIIWVKLNGGQATVQLNNPVKL
ncbi:hypothetical protein A1Q1_05476 [Trichosporon asahii var. asahii CBS 2479]|uniref:Extracellular serine-rich protein n=1 Tax=Trichosporon asahii var. asahii (strain ATCC 90039 / CBS 2479 / JCM 2466 / KCTC 7840 / NBRC 103889/ NCYC 2677 / UAMH 7654) TaxID=1186058 RepID=J5TR05_TRIAS|nr:hypothetical protein A1Q1_05476 [Trichosporon asahii var. asahii CBS 2479]EJT52266.1 hypothetical protein A1Q1_05476 [Trichosporon asahii var. asahii CBS 2479]